MAKYDEKWMAFCTFHADGTGPGAAPADQLFRFP